MKIILTLLIFSVSLNTSAQVPNYVPTNGLWGWWPFSGNANDESGNANNGTVNGATLSADRQNTANSAYFFNGSDASIICQNVQNAPTQVVSVSTWFKQTQSFSTSEYICLGSATNTGWGCVASSTAINLDYGAGCSGIGGSILTNNAIALDNWYHIVYVSKGVGDSTKIYINGSLNGTVANPTSTGSCSSQNLYFGVDIFSAPEFVNGSLDDIGIWNRVLTSDEVLALYSTTTAIGQTSKKNKIGIFPNPVNDIITANLPQELIGSSFKIFDQMGRTVITGLIQAQSNQIDFSTLKPGTYLFEVTDFNIHQNIIKR